MFRAKSLALILAFLFVLFTAAAKPALAIWPFDQIGEFFQTSNGQTKSDALYATNLNSQYKLLYGCSFDEIKNKQTKNDPTCDNNLKKGLTQGAVPAILATALNVSSNLPDINNGNGQYLANLIPFKQAFADRPLPADFTLSGTERLYPIFVFWEFMRNLAYSLAILVLVAIGFMIMFRKQIDPRTTVTATAAIPSILVALLLITFSWPVAGLLVDLGTLLIATVTNWLASIGTVPIAGITASEIQNGLIHNYGTEFDLKQWGLNPLIGAPIGWITLFATIALVLQLIIRWLTVFFLTIASPLVFLISAIPGQGGVASGWFKSFLVSVLVFPATFFVVNFGYWIAAASGPLQGPPAFYVDANLRGLMQVGILILATRIPAYIEQAFDALPSGHVQRSGADFGQLARRMPVIGGFFG